MRLRAPKINVGDPLPFFPVEVEKMSDPLDEHMVFVVRNELLHPHVKTRPQAGRVDI